MMYHSFLAFSIVAYLRHAAAAAAHFAQFFHADTVC
jgi:hypothetical protein